MSRCLNGPNGCMTDCHLMRHSGESASFFNLFANKCREAVYCMHLSYVPGILWWWNSWDAGGV